MTSIHGAAFMSNNQAYIQALQWIVRNLQWEIQSIQDIINWLHQEEDPDLILIKAELIFDFDNEEPTQFALPPVLLQQEVEADTQDLNLKDTSQIAIAHAPTNPCIVTQKEHIVEARRRAREWAA